MIFELQEVDLKQSRFYQEVFAEGREEGHDQGRETEARALVLRLLRRRFGSVSAEAQARIEALSLTHLETLAEDLLGFQVAGDVARWLDGFQA